jgi:hypothetical protein
MLLAVRFLLRSEDPESVINRRRRRLIRGHPTELQTFNLVSLDGARSFVGVWFSKPWSFAMLLGGDGSCVSLSIFLLTSCFSFSLSVSSESEWGARVSYCYLRFYLDSMSLCFLIALFSTLLDTPPMVTALAYNGIAVGGTRVSHSTRGFLLTWSSGLHAERYCFVVRLFRYLYGRALSAGGSVSVFLPLSSCRSSVAPQSHLYRTGRASPVLPRLIPAHAW